MAEEKEVLLYEVKFDAKEATKRAQEYQVSLARLRAEKANTEKEFKSGVITIEEYGKSMLAIESQIAKATAGLNEQKKALSDYEKAQKQASGSMQQLSGTIADLRQRYTELSKAQRESVEGTNLLAYIRDLSDQYDEHNKKLNTSKKTVTDFIKDFNLFGVSVGDTIDMFKKGTEGVKVFGKALTATRLGLLALGAAIPLGILALLVGSLLKTQAGMDFLTRKTAGLTAAFRVIMGAIQETGMKVYEAFKSGELAGKVLDKIVENITTRFKGLKLIAEGVISLDWSKIGNGAAQASTGVENLAGKAQQLAQKLNDARLAAEANTRQQQALREEERALNIERAKSQALIEQYKMDADDTRKSEAERSAAALKAFNLENSILQKSLDLQQRKIDLLKKEKPEAQRTADEKEAIAQEEVRLEELKRDSKARQTEIQNDLNRINLEGIEKAKAAQKAAADELIFQAEKALLQAKRNGAETLAIEEILIRRRAAAALLDAKGAQERKKIEIQVETDIFDLRVQHALEVNERELNIQASYIKAKLAAVKEGSAQELTLQAALIQNQANLEKEQIRASIKNKRELDARIEQIDAESKARLLDAYKQYAIRQIELDQQKAERQQQIAQNLLSRFVRDQEKRNTLEADAAAVALARSKEGSAEELAAKIRLLEAQRSAAITASQGEKSAILRINAETDREIADLRKQFLLKKIDEFANLAQSAFSSLDTLVSTISQQQLKVIERAQDDALASAGNNAEARAQIEENYGRKRMEIERDIAKKKQKIASVENIINTAASVTKAFVEFGPVLGAIMAAIALANGIAQQAVIDSQTFARGGVIDGPSHAHGGVSYQMGKTRVELEGGEGVINKHAMAIPWVRSYASSLNQVAGNGVAFANTTHAQAISPQRLALGGVVPFAGNTTNVNGLTAEQVRSIITDTMRNLPPSIVTVQDIQTGVANKVRVEDRASVGRG